MHPHTQVQSEIYKEQHFNIQFLRKRYELNSNEGASLSLSKKKKKKNPWCIADYFKFTKLKNYILKKVALVQLSNSVQIISWSELKVNWIRGWKKKNLYIFTQPSGPLMDQHKQRRGKRKQAPLQHNLPVFCSQRGNSLTCNSKEMSLNSFYSVFILICWILSLIQCLMFSFFLLPWENV